MRTIILVLFFQTIFVALYAQNDRPALIIIDWQYAFDQQEVFGGNRNNLSAEQNTRMLLDAWREKKLPIIHVKHTNNQNPKSVFAPSQKSSEIKDIVKPLNGEPVIMKSVHSAFIGTNLKRTLDSLNITTIVLAGIQTDKCVSTTARMARDFGLITYVVSDATATFDATTSTGKKIPAEIVHETNLASLHREFATVITTAEMIALVGL